MAKYKVGYVAGIFDIIHIGHIELLRYAKELCDKLIVAVGTDEFLLLRKGHGSIIPFEERCEIVRSIRYVDEVVPEDDLDKIGEYMKYRFDVMFAGDDHIDEEIYILSQIKLKELGVETIFIPHTNTISSSIIKTRIIKGETYDKINNL